MNHSSLYRFIDNEKVRAFNELVEGSVAKVILPFDLKLQTEHVCKSEKDDAQMIVIIPFTASVKVTSLCLVGVGASCPSKIAVWANREDIDFDNCEDVKPTHAFEISENPLGELEYPMDPVKFQNIHSLTLWISENHGDDQTAFTFLGFRGGFVAARVGVVVAAYESRAQLADHKVPEESKNFFTL